MDGKAWLRRNVAPYEEAELAGGHLSRSFLYSDMPGYVSLTGIKKVDSPDFAGMPFDALRNQTELILIEKHGDTWARVSDMLYSPAETVSVLKAGENPVTIGDDGYNQWRVANEDMVLSFARPEEGRIIVFSPDDAPIYDSVLDSGDAYAAKGSHIETAGVAGDVFTVTARLMPADEKN